MLNRQLDVTKLFPARTQHMRNRELADLQSTCSNAINCACKYSKRPLTLAYHPRGYELIIATRRNGSTFAPKAINALVIAIGISPAVNLLGQFGAAMTGSLISYDTGEQYA